MFDKVSVTLAECYDIEYLKKLNSQYRYSIVTNDFIDNLSFHIFKMWKVYDNNQLSGLVYMSKINGVYTFDAYKDKHSTAQFASTVVAGRLALKLMKDITNVIYSIHIKRNRLATKALGILGFDVINSLEVDCCEYLVFRKEL